MTAQVELVRKVRLGLDMFKILMMPIQLWNAQMPAVAIENLVYAHVSLGTKESHVSVKHVPINAVQLVFVYLKSSWRAKPVEFIPLLGTHRWLQAARAIWAGEDPIAHYVRLF